MSDHSSAQPAGIHSCDVCGETMLSVHCKLVCTNCGYRRDCSDPDPWPLP